jgi:quercetin dioxygenase-like cupin family protein
MVKLPGMKVYDWNTVAEEHLNPRVSRKMIHSEKLTVARISIQKYAIIPEHQHPNEQISMVERGSLEFRFGGEKKVVKAGEMMVIPSDVPHAIEALEDSVALDVFAPPRQDWIRGDDAYLRR